MAKPINDTLSELLPRLREIANYPTFGGNERSTASDLERRINRLLNPESREALAADAEKFVARFYHFIEGNRQQAQSHEAAKEQASADHAARYAAHRAKQLAVVERERKRVEEMIERNARAAVAEVIG